MRDASRAEYDAALTRVREAMCCEPDDLCRPVQCNCASLTLAALGLDEPPTTKENPMDATDEKRHFHSPRWEARGKQIFVSGGHLFVCETQTPALAALIVEEHNAGRPVRPLTPRPNPPRVGRCAS